MASPLPLRSIHLISNIVCVRNIYVFGSTDTSPGFLPGLRLEENKPEKKAIFLRIQFPRSPLVWLY